ncbi:DUF3829 domain-containing protein [Aggregatimonas sangjinii]|uniref:DUF3829 domain-containing protein n=1 Tax=Aggregatimonas sangjinii TaxID=2583587 RepID=A0A5B7SX14_9FLAO|nr:DUF3829 domain-containing protein [Aggregatimonas sangjinii]QCX01733.1 DUF3829 domain-containing protein [Aggregatimonas sangjinii]
MGYKTIILSAFLVMTFLSCKDSAKNNDPNSAEALSAVTTTYDNIYENPAYIEVYNEYVTYLNDITSSYDASQTYYFNAFPDDYPENLKGSPSLVTISDYPDDHLERALRADLKIESLEKPAQTVNEYILTLRRLMNHADGYYERQEYLDDAAKRGKSLHDSIVPAFFNLNEAVGEFRDQITAIEQKMTAVELENYKNEGLNLRYSLLKIITIARETRAFTQVETMDEYANLELKNVVDVRKRLSENIQELEKSASDKSQFTREFGSNSTAEGYYNFGFKRASNDLVKHLRSLEQRLKTDDFEPEIPNNTPSGIQSMMIKQFYNGDGMPQMIMETEGKLIEAYNDIIN